MNPRVIDVNQAANYTLIITFENGEIRLFDMKKYLCNDIFKCLADITLFKTARVFIGTIQWANGLDLCPDTLYLESVPYNS